MQNNQPRFAQPDVCIAKIFIGHALQTVIRRVLQVPALTIQPRLQAVLVHIRHFPFVDLALNAGACKAQSVFTHIVGLSDQTRPEMPLRMRALSYLDLR